MDNKKNDTTNTNNINNKENKRKKIIFCLPGRTYSNQFLLAWSDLILWCSQNNFDLSISQNYSSVVHFARTLCLGGDNTKGKLQKPFDNKLDYDYIMWIDSDIIFKVDDFKKLLESENDITSGIYKMENTINYPTVINWDTKYLMENGNFEFLDDNKIKELKDSKKLLNNRYLNVEYTGMGWMLIKKDVIEQLKYPWFYHDLYEINDFVEMFSEDVSFCKNLKKAGFDIYVDLDVRVGHYKSFII